MNVRLKVSFVMSILASGAILSAVGQAYAQQTSANFAIGAVVQHVNKPLNAQQRKQRDHYFSDRLGLQFGVPEGARESAILATGAAEPASAREFGNTSSPAWTAIGPLPLVGNQANFGGVLFGPTFAATGRVSAIAADKQASGRIFVGAANGGVWMSTNGGLTYKQIFQTQPTQAIGAIALDPVHTTPTTIYVATGEANGSDSYYGQGIFKSTNLGASWTRIGGTTFDHASFARLAIDTSRNPPHLFAAVGGGASLGRADPIFEETTRSKFGLWRSLDGGKTWTQYPLTTFSPPGMTGGCELGNSTPAVPCPAEDVVIDPKAPKNIYAQIEFDDVFRSTDGGNTWKPMCFTNDSPCTFPNGLGNMDRASLAVSPSASGTVYAMIGDPNSASYAAFAKSTNSGTTWSIPFDSIGKPIVPQKIFGSCSFDADHCPMPTDTCTAIDGGCPNNFSQSSYDQFLIVDPANTSHVSFGGVGLYDSSNSGKSWNFLPTNGGTHSDQHAVTYDPFKNRVYLGNDGGAYSFNYATRTFTTLSAGFDAVQIQGIGPHPTNNTRMLAGLQDNGTILYTGTNQWRAVETGDGGFALFDRVNPNHFAYHTFATDGTVLTFAASSDGGTTWTQLPFDVGAGFGDKGLAFYPPLAPDPGQAKRILTGGHFAYAIDVVQDKIFRLSTQDLTGGCPDGACAIQDIEYASTGPTDRSKAWSLSMRSGFGCGSGGRLPCGFRVFNTTKVNLNSGVIWTNVTGKLGFNTANTQATGIATDVRNDNHAVLTISGFTAATGIGHVFQTLDFGAHWTRIDGQGGPSPFPDVPALRPLIDRRDSTGKTILVGTDIGVFRTTNGGVTWFAFNLGTIPADPVFDIEQNNLGTIFAGTHGRGAFRLQ